MAKSPTKQALAKPKKKNPSNRLVPHIKHNGGNFNTPPMMAEYVGKRGILFRSDCLDLITNIRDNTIDLVFADPPFNLGKSYGTPKLNDAMAVEAYRGWCRTWLLELTRVLKPGGSLFLYHLPMWLMDFGAWLNSLQLLDFRNWIALKMKNGFPFKGRVQPAHYGILYFVKKGADPTFNVVRTKSPTCRHCGKLIRDYGGYRDKFKRFEDEQGVPWIGLSDFWDDTRPARQDKSRQNQVNELPLHIPERIILMASKPKDIILDCFAGGGSTLHAAQLNNRLWIGGEIGKPASVLRRIATFAGTDETSAPPRRLLNCFTKQIRDAIVHIDTTSSNRPIAKVSRLLTASASMEKDARKSKVLGF